jgi:hypothetical protein
MMSNNFFFHIDTFHIILNKGDMFRRKIENGCFPKEIESSAAVLAKDELLHSSYRMSTFRI